MMIVTGTVGTFKKLRDEMKIIYICVARTRQYHIHYVQFYYHILCKNPSPDNRTVHHITYDNITYSSTPPFSNYKV